MPEGLQQGDVGQLLQERIDGLDNWSSGLSNIDFDFEFDEDEIEAKKEETADEFQAREAEWEERKSEAEIEFIQNLLEEIQGFDPEL